MGISRGSTAPYTIKRGSTTLYAVYRGSQLLWPPSLAGVIAASSAASGSVAVLRRVSGAMAAVSVLAGVPSDVTSLGSAQAVSALSGLASRLRAILAVNQSSSQVAGVAKRVRLALASVAGSSQLSAVAGRERLIAGALAPVSALTGFAGRSIASAASSAAVSAFAGVTARARSVAGASAAVAATSGIAGRVRSVSGSCAASSALSGTDSYLFTNADAAAYVGAMTVKPSATDQAAYDAFFAGLATDSIVIGTDILGMHCLKSYTKQAAYVDMIDPANSGKVLTENGTVTWTSYGGAAAGGGAGDNLDTGQAANAALTFTDASFFQKMRTQNGSRVGVMGYRGSRGTINHGGSIIPVGYIHSSASVVGGDLAANDQFIVLTRNGTTQQFYVNGSASGSSSAATDNTLNETNTIKYLGDGNASGTGTVDFAGYGAAMNATKWANFHSRVATLLSTLGT